MPRREIRIERFLQTTQPFSHDTADLDDRRAGHLFVQTPVCRTPNRDPSDFNPLDFPADHRAPEVRAMHICETSRRLLRGKRARPAQDRTDRWIELTTAALWLMVRLQETGGDFEAAMGSN